MATVEVTFTPLPVHVRTARLVATAVARRSGVAESLLDEVRLAVGEACSRAVEAHLRHCPGEPIRVALTDDDEQFEVVVTDAVPDTGHGAPAGAAEAGGDNAAFSAGPGGYGPDFPLDGEIPLRLPEGVGLAVIAGLADDVRITPAGTGTSVTMSWKRRAVLRALSYAPDGKRRHRIGRVRQPCVSPGVGPPHPRCGLRHRPSAASLRARAFGSGATRLTAKTAFMRVVRWPCLTSRSFAAPARGVVCPRSITGRESLSHVAE